MAWLLTHRDLLDMSWSAAGRVMARHHSTIIHAVERMSADIEQGTPTGRTASLVLAMLHGSQELPTRAEGDYCIGIDPGVKTGVAVWDRKREMFAHLDTADFWRAFNLCLVYARSAERVRVYVEDPSQNKPVFAAKTKGQTWKKALRIAQRVGMNQREGQLLADGIEHAGIEVVRVRPTRGKMSIEQFEGLTGIGRGKCSQHARDAAMLVWGR